MQSTIQYIKKELEGIYPETEIQGLTRIILEWATGWNYTQQMFNREAELDESVLGKIILVVKRLKKHEPIQYILEETEFFGMKLKVTPAVLIPRQETEELVQFILEKNIKQGARILDIGTGSGCIALALKNNLKNVFVSGVDISKEVLEVARKNAGLNHLSVDLVRRNILEWEKYDWYSYNIIVSNPPYVKQSEKEQMQKNVLDYEPANALFVSDDDPLIFYRAIAEMAAKHLTINGWLFFEINENLAYEIEKLLTGFGFVDVEIRKDINDKSRMAAGRKNS